MHSVKLEAVTQARVSEDIACWNNGSAPGPTGDNGCGRGMVNYWNFNTGPPSMLAWGLGILPYQDSFFSSSDQKGSAGCISCLFTNWSEPYPWTHAVASALTAGPVAPGDYVGKANTSLLNMLTRVDGTLLKPDRPATPLDSYWSVRAFGASAQAPQGELGPRGELWTTETTLGGGSYTWHYAFGLMLDAPYHLSVAELVASGQAWPDNTHPGVSLDH